MTLIEEHVYLKTLEGSIAVIIPNKVSNQLRLVAGQKIGITVENASIILTPVKNEPSNIHELFADWQDDNYRERELSWGKPTGSEFPWNH
ncbi:AbrB/MazE/SpoVT family DNA-binding domain-containing protein [Levilactobacillus parabrevis]|uniref:AbrB/MazE/SpoVT family DNA-binding domain-containing protein n=1 Tax=Levilactobacillus parabrevis TaxID=357278 RepID=UPI0021A8E280|nr:PbsX family transcriptional regulator [Levilactobacillus parabrevis]MCT4488918.1 PbsX family transcriptional regulator [Levilactobacillus parabrevis]MCT4489123.1 PbsX family transcriptional regulator [Levilactobacillus parabrevis]